VRILAICNAPESAASKYYLVVPRAKGGAYAVMTLVRAIDFTATLRRPAKDLNDKIRAIILTAISKLDEQDLAPLQ
jgi:hypothetical protein